jgi:hypothetical protein
MKKARFVGWQMRLRKTLIAVPLVAISFALYWLARNACSAPVPAEFVSNFWVGFVGFLLIGLLLGIFYIFSGPFYQPVYWATIFASADLGLVIGAALYVWPLRSWILPQFHLPETTNATQALIAVGMLDGMLAGAVNGFIVTAIDAKATTLTLAGVTRFVSVSCFVIAAMIISQWIEQSSKIGDIFSPLFFLLMCGAIRLGITWLDRKAAMTQ